MYRQTLGTNHTQPSLAHMPAQTLGADTLNMTIRLLTQTTQLPRNIRNVYVGRLHAYGGQAKNIRHCVLSWIDQTAPPSLVPELEPSG
jgi:hypothetical protein